MIIRIISTNVKVNKFYENYLGKVHELHELTRIL